MSTAENAELVEAGKQVEPDTAEEDTDIARDIPYCSCKACPRCISDLDMRYIVARHLHTSDKHLMPWVKAAGIALDPNDETFADRNMARAELEKSQQKQQRQDDDPDMQAKSKKRKAESDDSIQAQIEEMQQLGTEQLGKA